MTALALDTSPTYNGPVAALGERIRELRQSKGLTLRVAGQRSGMTASNWSGLEQGRRPNPTLSVLFAVAAALDVSLVELLEGVEPPED